MTPDVAARNRRQIPYEKMRDILDHIAEGVAGCPFERYGWSQHEFVEEENYRDFVEVHKDLHKAEALMIRRLREELNKCMHIAAVGGHPELGDLCTSIRRDLNDWLRARRKE